tara:strand:+ start:640 stop:1224 length:585 start_codon:yes stop_codon:yes gene_type:complete
MSEYCVHDYWIEGYAQGDKLMLAAAPAISTSVDSAVITIKVVAATPAIAASASAAAQRVREAQSSKTLTMTITQSMQRVLQPVIDQIGITTTPTANVIKIGLFRGAGSAASSATAAAAYTLPCAATTNLTSIMQSSARYKWVNEAETSSQWVNEAETSNQWVNEAETTNQWVNQAQASNQWVTQAETNEIWTVI